MALFGMLKRAGTVYVKVVDTQAMILLLLLIINKIASDSIVIVADQRTYGGLQSLYS